MPLFEPFGHYLAYGATDQETFRDVQESYDGLVVPGTIAAWQRQGTGGFVLTLSATQQASPYVIDPRFPLFQQALKDPKQSHVSLAGLLGDPKLVGGHDPSPNDFSEERLKSLGEHWARFNTAYGTAENQKFSKYAARLQEEVDEQNAQLPEAVLAPYFAADGTRDPWWQKSKQLFELTRAACAEVPCLRVVCAKHSGALGELLADLPGEDIVLWVSGLEEPTASSEDLRQYRTAIREASARGNATFALYGGFFSVVLGVEGLRGSAHGVGFSEHRSWVQLPTSGAAPARYYLRRWHRYVSQDLAQQLWVQDPTLTQCACTHCSGRPPLALSYHELMKHSVIARQEEIDHFQGLELDTVQQILRDEHDALSAQVAELTLPPAVKRKAEQLLEHLPVWADALDD